jgi:hypothetical protein
MTPEERSLLTKLVGKATVSGLVSGPAGVAASLVRNTLGKKLTEKVTGSDQSIFRQLWDKLFGDGELEEVKVTATKK